MKDPAHSSSALDPSAAFARRCTSIRDPKVRVSYVTHEIRERGPEHLVELLAAAQAAAPRFPEYADLLLAMAIALSDPATAAVRREAAYVASASGQTAIVELLGDRDPATPDLGELRVPDFGQGRPLTLGERKALARRRDRQLLERVLRDPHPGVISILLENPSLTEPDVVRLAASRPIDPAALTEIFRNPRWAVRYPVRRALVQNPYCPLELALRMVPLLNASDARSFAAAPSLRTPIREACARATRPTLQ
ncbi:MAG: hypothetical protein AAGE52_40305 [Myxococcota bacterium]